MPLKITMPLEILNRVLALSHASHDSKRYKPQREKTVPLKHTKRWTIYIGQYTYVYLTIIARKRA